MKKIIIIIFLLLPAQLFAEGFKPYLAGNAGLHFPNSIPANDYLGFETEVHFDKGFTGGIGLGFMLGQGFRGEIDYSYRTADITTMDVIFDEDYRVNTDADGYLKSHSFMANLYKDFTMSEVYAFYIGAGVGGALEKWAVTSAPGLQIEGDDDMDDEDYGDGGPVDNSISYDPHRSSKWAVAYQVSTGISAKITDGFYANVGYKYFTTSGQTTSHNVEFGVRFNMF